MWQIGLADLIPGRSRKDSGRRRVLAPVSNLGIGLAQRRARGR